jgi:DNA repair exonuclease SbcCD nuclease subunit
MRNLGDIRILLCADTHLGFDEPMRPRVERRRRGPDFFDNFKRVLDHARDRRVDLVIHGGDLFFRSRLPAPIVDRVYGMLLGLAADGIPILIVPGNHERSLLPSSLFLNHPNIHILARPETRVFDLRGTKVAVTGIPCERVAVRQRFRSLLDMTGWVDVECDARFLCLHQAVEGARVGPSDFTFRSGADVIRMADLPSAFDAVLAGHIHRSQVLSRRRPDGTSMPVLYPGSTERTSFAEMREPKGYLDLTLGGDSGPGRRHLTFDFVPLPARPMHDLLLGPGLDNPDETRAFLKSQLARLDPHSIIRIRWADGVPLEARSAVTGALLREVAPPTMNVELGGAFSAARSGDRRALR